MFRKRASRPASGLARLAAWRPHRFQLIRLVQELIQPRCEPGSGQLRVRAKQGSAGVGQHPRVEGLVVTGRVGIRHEDCGTAQRRDFRAVKAPARQIKRSAAAIQSWMLWM